MTALDADTRRYLRELLAKARDYDWDAQVELKERLYDAAPALLDAAEAVERIRTLADEGLNVSPWHIRAALAPPPDNKTEQLDASFVDIPPAPGNRPVDRTWCDRCDTWHAWKHQDER